MAGIQVPEDLSSLPDDELEVLWEDLAAHREELRLQAKRLNEERNARVDAQAARERLSAMTSAERAALAQIIAVEGIESQEAFGADADAAAAEEAATAEEADQ